MKVHLSGWMATGLAATALALLAVGTLAWRSVQRLGEIRNRVEHTHEVLAGLEATLSDLQDVETGGRGFVITSQEKFLEPYQAALKKLDTDVARLETLVADRPEQSLRLAALKPHIAARIAATREQVATRRENGFEAAQRLALAGLGKQAMDNARAVVAEMEAEERDLLRLGSSQAAAAAGRVYGAFLLAGVSIVALLATVGIFINRDVAHRERAASELRASEARFFHAFHTSPAAITITRIADGKFIDTNQTFLNLFEFQREEVIGHTSTELKILTAEERGSLIKAQIAAGGLSHAELSARSKSGRPIQLLFSSKPMELAGEPHHVTTLIDITARKQAEAALRESEAKFAAAFHSSPASLAITTLDGKFVEANLAFCDLIGYSRGEIIDKTSVDLGLVNAAVREKLVANLQSHGGSLKNVETTFRVRGGGLRDVLFSLQTILLNGVPHRLSTGIDITARKQAEAALQQSERSLTEAQRIAHVGSWSWNLTGLAQWTDELYRIYGVSPETFTPTVESFFDLVYPDDRLAMQEWFRACAAGESPADYEFRAVRPDGTVRFISSRGELIRDAGGRPIRMVGTAQDITERKQAEATLGASEARLRLSVEAANVGLWDWDLKTNRVYFSREWKSQIGYRDDEITNDFSEWQSRVHPDDLEPALQKVRAYLANPQGRHEAEFRFRHKDGSYRWIYTHGDVLRDADGKPARMLGCHIDITERKRAEAAVQASEQRLRSILDTMFVFVGLMNLDGEIVEVNQAPLDAAGLKREDVLGRKVPETYWYAHSPAVQAQARAALTRAGQGEVVREDLLIRVAEGQNILIDVTFAPLRDAAGRVAQIVGSAVDITARKQAEAALRQSGEQLRALAARLESIREEERTRIAREVHDVLGQLLTGLKMDLAALTRHAEKIPDDDARAALKDKASSAGSLADDLIESVQRISADLRPSILDNIGLPAAVRFEARRFAERSGVACEVLEAPESLALDSNRATGAFRILQEILTNVARHAGATRVEIQLAVANGALTLSARDNGRGIDERARDDSESLGLLGMRERARLLGGTVAIHGEAGRGTMVTLIIPTGEIKPAEA